MDELAEDSHGEPDVTLVTHAVVTGLVGRLTGVLEDGDLEKTFRSWNGKTLGMLVIEVMIIGGSTLGLWRNLLLCGGGRDRGREEGLEDVGGQGSVSAFHRRKVSVTKKLGR